ncbi:lamin tail domain-containing protein [Phycisphaerales bacterium AB-hyl4]|uniref:Lamin tail domain-containing protein n=1 Tax=Natronomicrosphaera hydrolytica TaxID=3242702 RepID=A0ABV4U3J3_9BACT
MLGWRWLVLGVMVLGVGAVAWGDEIVITEIMYDPASEERWPAKTEWIEIYNRGQREISLEGWFLANERGQTHPIHGRVMIQPREAVVLIPGNQTVKDFRAAWGEGYQVIPLDGWHKPGLHQLTNEPSDKTGVLTLRRPTGDVADEVNYDNEGRWPPNKPDGPSIYLLPHAIDTTSNNDGSNWARSESGRHGARHARPDGGYDQRDVGSPGVVVTVEDEREQREGDDGNAEGEG